jgi:hypothetical protein
MQEVPILPDPIAAWLGVAAAAPFSICAQLSINKALVCNPTPKVSVIRKAISAKARQGSFPNFLIAPKA